MFKRARAAAADVQEQVPKDRAEKRREREVDEIDHAGRRAAVLGAVRLLDDRVGKHGGAGRDAGYEAEAVGRKEVWRAVQDEQETNEQGRCAAEDDGLAPADAVRQRA